MLALNIVKEMGLARQLKRVLSMVKQNVVYEAVEECLIPGSRGVFKMILCLV
jgi:hypothetical protein